MVTITYDGSKFFGFAKQPNKISVVGSLEIAFKNINEKSQVVGSGRTDRAVHATGQVFHIDISTHWQNRLQHLQNILNRNISHIEITKISLADKNFHARFSAKKRVYRYIYSKDINVFNSSYLSHIANLDKNIVSDAIKLFCGCHNFSMFSKRDKDIKNRNRVIYDAIFYEYKNYYVFKFTGSSFLRSQIRMMVDFIVKISQKTLSKQNLIEQLTLKKQYSSTLASPNGLYLCKVIY
jgi:tRNA pseudouridine38-40 synthase